MSPQRKAAAAVSGRTEPTAAAGDRQRKAATAFRTISEVSDELQIAKHVLRFWEIKFTQLRPMKRGGGRRFYRPDDVELLRGIRHLLQAEAFTIKGVQKILREQGVEAVKRAGAETMRASPAGISGRKSRMAAAPDRSLTASSQPEPAARPELAAGSPDAPAELEMAMRAAIAELEACRTLLRVPAATPGSSARRARAKP